VLDIAVMKQTPPAGASPMDQARIRARGYCRRAWLLLSLHVIGSLNDDALRPFMNAPPS
jgi:hypothetical protein